MSGQKDEKFIAIQVVAEVSGLTPEQRESITDRIIAVLGCDGTEDPCVMVLYASTVVNDAEVAYDWLH